MFVSSTVSLSKKSKDMEKLSREESILSMLFNCNSVYNYDINAAAAGNKYRLT